MPHSQVSLSYFLVFFHLVFVVPIVHSFTRLSWCILLLLTLSTVPLSSLHRPVFFCFLPLMFIVFVVRLFVRLSWCILHMINEMKWNENVHSIVHFCSFCICNDKMSLDRVQQNTAWNEWMTRIYIARLKAYKCMLNLPRLTEN